MSDRATSAAVEQPRVVQIDEDSPAADERLDVPGEAPRIERAQFGQELALATRPFEDRAEGGRHGRHASKNLSITFDVVRYRSGG